MADTVTLDPGTGGAVIATDDLGATGHVQLVKLVDGTDNGTGRIAGDASNGLDVDVTRSALPTGASTAAKQPALGTAGAASADVLSVQGVASMTPLLVNGSGVTQPVSGTVTANLAAGTNNIGDVDVLTLPALPAGTNNIGDVDVLTVPADPFGANADAAATAGSTGSIQAKLRLMTSQLDAIKTSVETLDNAIAGTEMQVDVLTMPSTAVTNAGTFAVQDSQKLADDAAFTVGTTPLSPVGYLADQTSTDSVNEGDIGAARITLDRKQIVTLAPSADTEGLLVANNIDVDETEDAVKASAGKLYGWFWYNDGATEVYVKYYNDTVANVVVGTTVPFMTIPIPAGSASNIEWSHGIPFSAAITVAATTAATTADTGAPATNQVVGFSLYQ